MDAEREKEIQELCKQVLEIGPNFYDNPNGPYENTCPFCLEVAYGYGNKIYISMKEIRHDHNCAYLIAKGLSTK